MPMQTSWMIRLLFENLPENANVKAINGVPAAGLTTTPEGKLENIPLPDACNIIELEKMEIFINTNMQRNM